MTVSAKGQITIPAAVREKYGIQAGDKIVGETRREGFVLRKPLNFLTLKGVLTDVQAVPDNEEELLTEDVGRRLLERW
ncbi:MAG: AbrB/MazE/SpoVT family DNA-binding domain-containing protein [Candidatus Accumulibacter sp.]|nr:AbrB/MazE/SpoVT family DNA-binding domain-containing protein [Accumulibacter sp.]